MEKDEVRCRDSFEAFDEIFSIAEEKEVDFLLLGGNLFHENNPSTSTLVKAIEILRRHCLGDLPAQFQFVNDQTLNFANTVGDLKYENPHSNVSLPVFSIHGNHDCPAGVENLSAVDILSSCNLLNYFGKMDLGGSGVEQITMCPILIRKGSSSIALYGLGNIRDERFNRMFQTSDAVQWIRPEAQGKENVNNAISEHSLPQFLNFFVLGHEHECLIDLQEVQGMSFHVAQPGSSIATLLTEGESKPKHGNQCRPTKIFLKSVRPFEYTEVILIDGSDINPNDQNSILEHLDKVRDLIEKSNEKAAIKTENKLPLVRVKVDNSGFMTIDPQKFGQKYVGKVANPQDILIFTKASRKGHGEGKFEDSERLRPEDLNQQNIEASDVEAHEKNTRDSLSNNDPGFTFLTTLPSKFFRSKDSDSTNETSPSPSPDSDSDGSERSYYRIFFREICFLGEGGYGAVFKCEHLLDKKLYAIKKIGYNEQDLETAMRETIIHSTMKHSHIVQYNNSWIEEGFIASDLVDDWGCAVKRDDTYTHTLYLQMEICHGSLEEMMANGQFQLNVQGNKAIVYEYMKQIFKALDYIHSRGYIHADISKGNIFFDDMGLMKVGDFGKAKKFEDAPLVASKKELGVLLYRAPETFKPRILIDPKMDIYSAGLIFYELVNRMNTET